MTPTTNNVGPTTSATERLRALLDERGVEWRGGLPTETMVEADGLDLLYVALPDGRVRAFIRNYLTPEQAVEATLGRGTCRIEYGPSAVFRNETGPDWTTQDFVARCSECGHRMHQDPFTGEWPRYCPWCGAKVVDA